MGGLDKKN